MTNTDTNNVASKPSFDINFDTSFDISELSQQIEQSVTSQAVAAENHPTRQIPPP